MKTKHILLCCLTMAACIQTFAEARGYAYWMEEPKWTEERAQAREELKTARIYITNLRNTHWYFAPDYIISDSIIDSSQMVKGGEVHRVEYTQDGREMEDYYYLDPQGRTIPVLLGVVANNGQPYSLDAYYYIDADGLIRFNIVKWMEMVLWCLNVLVSPWLWLAVLIYLLYKAILYIVIKTRGTI